MNVRKLLCPLLTCCILILTNEKVTAQDVNNQLFIDVSTNSSEKSKHQRLVEDQIYLDVSIKTINSIQLLKPVSLELPMPVSLEIGTLKLSRTNIFANNYQLKTSDGHPQNASHAYTFYQGHVKGDTNSLAVVTFFNEEVKILISKQSQNFRINRLSESSYVFFNENDLKNRQSYECQTVDKGVNSPLPELTRQHSIVGNCVEIYFECDYDSYLKNGSDVSNSEAWLAAIFNEVQAIYANEDIPISISEALIWTSPDPYASLNNSFAILTQFQEEKNTSGFNGRLAHFLSTRNLGGGIAYVDVLCSQNSNYAVSASLETAVVPYPDYSWNVNVISHELGHNFGSRHTHDCVWNGNNTQLDDCGNQVGSNQGDCYDASNPLIPATGTMMSYCHLISGIGIDLSLGFGHQPGDLLRAKFSNAACTTGNCTRPDCVDLISPVPGSSNVDVTTTIRWTTDLSANGYRVTLGTSPTNGSIVNDLDVGLVNEYQSELLPFGQFIYAKIIPYNSFGAAIGCQNFQFKTEQDIDPLCVQLAEPVNGSMDVFTDATFSWVDAIGNQLGYKLNVGTTPGGGEIMDNIDVGNVNHYTPESLPVTTTIFVKIIPYGQNGDMSSCAITSFTTNDILQYCESRGNGSMFEWIESFSFGPMQNNSGNSGGYGDFTNLIIGVNSGQSYSLSIQPAYSNQVFNEYFKVWIDYNRDGDFEESDELIFESGPSSTAVAGLITVPENLEPGIRRMRVAMKFNGASSSCEIFPYGEVEDYVVDVGSNVPCNLVTTTNETGPGSLISALNCSFGGDTIQFDSSLTSATIELANTFAVIGQNIVIRVEENADIDILGVGTPTVFDVLEGAQLHLIGIDIVSGTGILGGAIRNNGHLILEDVDIHLRADAPADASLISNLGTIECKGDVLLSAQ